MSQTEKIAVIDLGSNSFHAVVFEITAHRSLKQIDAFKKVLRFTRAITDEGQIPQEDMEAGIATLKIISQFISTHQPVVRAVATHAIRSSSNFEDFIHLVKDETGIEVEIIDGAEEARLCFIGMRHGLELPRGNVLGVDVGGGSTEIVRVKNQQLQYVTSLNIGSAAAHHRFIKGKSNRKKAVKDLKDYLVSRLFPMGLQIGTHNYDLCIATSGTAKALAYIDSHLADQNDLTDPHGYRLPSANFKHIEKALVQTWEPEAIASQFGIEESRAEIILAGCLIYNSLSELFGIQNWTVSTFGFREGVALDWYDRNRGNNEADVPQKIRSTSVVEFGARFGMVADYAERVAQRSLHIFGILYPHFLHIVRSYDKKMLRDVLVAASRLHEVGKFINPQGYHKNSYYIIANSALLGYSQKERHFIALVTRFSRKKPASHAKAEKKPYLTDHIDIINFLSSCLRLAKVFSRNPAQNLKSLAFEVESNKLRIAFNDPEEEHMPLATQLLEREQKHLSKALDIDIEYQYGPETT